MRSTIDSCLTGWSFSPHNPDQSPDLASMCLSENFLRKVLSSSGSESPFSYLAWPRFCNSGTAVADSVKKNMSKNFVTCWYQDRSNFHVCQVFFHFSYPQTYPHWFLRRFGSFWLLSIVTRVFFWFFSIIHISTPYLSTWSVIFMQLIPPDFFLILRTWPDYLIKFRFNFPT